MSPSECDRMHEQLHDAATELDVVARELRRDNPRQAAAVHLVAAQLRGLAILLPEVTRPLDVGGLRENDPT